MVFACFFLWPSSVPVTLVRRGWRQFFLPANGCSVCQDWEVTLLRVHRAERGGRAKGSPFLVSSPFAAVEGGCRSPAAGRSGRARHQRLMLCHVPGCKVDRD